jgi:hypothetical protein
MVLRFLLEEAPGIGRIKLAKFAYLADLEARRYLGRPITRFKYVFDQHGPFDALPFYAALTELQRGGFATQSEIPLGQYVGYEICPTSNPVEYDFDVTEAEVLSYVARTYLARNAQELCEDVVYETRPMRAAKPGEPLPMDEENRKSSDRLTFDLRRMLAGEAQARTGRTRPLADSLSELTARHH